MERDEFGRIPEEFAKPGDEFNAPQEDIRTTAKKIEEDSKKLKTMRWRRMLRALACAAMVTVIASETPDFLFPETDVVSLIADYATDATIVPSVTDYIADAIDVSNVPDDSDDVLSEEVISPIENTNTTDTEYTDSTVSVGQDAETGEQTGTEPVEEEFITCVTCNGHGFICPGSVAADDPEGCHGEMYVQCKACNGTGKEADGSPCSWCKGTLTHLCPSFEEHYECPDCGGTGKIEN